MNTPEPTDKQKIARLKEGLRRASKNDAPPPSNAAARGRALGLALRIISDLVAALIVGTGLGWLLDYATGLSPLFLLIFFFLGLAAGIINVMRTARAMNQPE